MPAAALTGVAGCFGKIPQLGDFVTRVLPREFVDPWGTPLRIYFSDNGIMVRSAGPNRRFDDSTTLECDDYFRSN